MDDDALTLDARDRGVRDVGQDGVKGEERAERSGVAAEPDHTGELCRRVAREHGHEHGVQSSEFRVY